MSSGRYSTRDFNTAALLVFCEYEILEVTREGTPDSRDGKGKTRVFHFEDSPQLQKDILDYRNGKKEGNLRKYKEATDIVKDLVHS